MNKRVKFSKYVVKKWESKIVKNMKKQKEKKK